MRDQGSEGDEGELLELLAERLRLGRERYGPLDVATKRGLDEAVEELLDAALYLGMELLRRRREAAGGASHA